MFRAVAIILRHTNIACNRTYKIVKISFIESFASSLNSFSNIIYHLFSVFTTQVKRIYKLIIKERTKIILKNTYSFVPNMFIILFVKIGKLTAHQTLNKPIIIFNLQTVRRAINPPFTVFDTINRGLVTSIYKNIFGTK